MNHDDFDRDPVTNDEFFGELADMIDLVDAMTQERLSGGELERRRKNIMDQVRGRTTAAQTDNSSPAPAPAPRPAMDTADPELCVRDGNNRITVRLTDWRSPTRAHQHHGDPPHSNVLDGAVLRHLGPAVKAAMADAERYRDGALRRAADIVKQAQQEADELLAEARRTLDEARQTAAAAGEWSAPRTEVPSERDRLTPLPNRAQTNWNTPGVGKPATLASSRWSSRRKILFVDVNRETADAMSCLADVIRLTAGAAVMSPTPYLMTAMTSICDVTRRTMWSTVLRDQSVAPIAGTSWLTTRGMPDAGFDLGEIDSGLNAVLYQVKSSNRPNAAWRHTLERLWGNPDPLAQLLPSTDHAALVQAFPDTCHADVTAVLARLRCAWDRQSAHQAGPHPTARWSTLIATGADSALGRLAPELLQLTGAASQVSSRLPILSSAQRLLFACDVDGFGQADASLQSRWQHAVRQILGEAASQSGLDSQCWQRQRAGDGELAILPLGTSWRTVFERLIGAVDRQLHEYNRYATADARLRLRVAVHEGAVAGTSDGFAGQAATTVTRLVDAPPLKQALDEHPKASMAVAVSDPVYHEVTHGQTPDQDRYMRITIPQSKGPTEGAWVLLPDDNMRFPGWRAPGSAAIPDDRWPTPRQRLQGGPRPHGPGLAGQRRS